MEQAPILSVVLVLLGGLISIVTVFMQNWLAERSRRNLYAKTLFSRQFNAYCAIYRALTKAHQNLYLHVSYVLPLRVEKQEEATASDLRRSAGKSSRLFHDAKARPVGLW